ncbi:alpha/beta fold hydrolase [Paenibacillus lignilyticus]|uniref:Alpha/beta hydrolase n=1 Tax=Paenibacillus lignilyticus TaxID=1172615 RepID=A0ABS5CMC1_9BACL|nr:alpha/beta hydrolase [Paenibacillus lignilyticus]MBP3967009.1 alpha/beta hydrolase [Paenibacillus lignilyticus]
MGFYVEAERGVKVYVEDVGYGRPVVFVHGWPVNRQMWEYQLNVVPKYGFRCISIDLRGFGKSDAPWHGYNYNRMSDDIRMVVESLGIQNATLVGFSMGGAIAIRYITRHAARGMCGLVLAAAAAPLMTQRPGYPYGKPASESEATLLGLMTDRPKTIDGFGQLFFHKPISDPFRTWFNGLGFESSPYGAIGGTKALRDEDLRADLAHVHVPTTILHGKQDRIVPFALGELQHQGIRNSRFIPFEDSGHGLFCDEREKFNRELLSVLTGKLGPHTPIYD